MSPQTGFGQLDSLARRPDDPVLVIQYPADIDAADEIAAAEAMYRAFIVIPCAGTKAHADALAGRDVVFWPWGASPAGRADCRKLINALAAVASRLRVVQPESPMDWLGPAHLKHRLNGHESPIEWARSRVMEIPHLTAPRPDLVSDYHPDLIEEEPAIVTSYTADPADEWPEPIDVFTRSALPALRRDWLPPEIADYVFDQSEIIGTDPCILAISALVCVATVCHDSIKIQPLRYNTGWTESARLWGAFVGDPSVKKTPALKAATGRLLKLSMDLAEQSAAEYDRYKRELKLHEKLESKFTSAAASNRPTGSLEPPPQRPPQRQLIASDTTVEALAILMQDNPGGVLLLHDELAAFFGGIDAYKQGQGKDGPFHLQAYNGGPYLVNRVGREALRIRNASECILGGIQPDAMARIAAKLPNDGLLQRFMVVIAQPVDGDGIDRAPNVDALAGWHGIIDWISQERPRADPAVTLSDGALRIRDALVRDLGTLRTVYAASPRLTSHLGKWSALFVRLCLVYHAIGCASRCQPVAGEVSPDTAKRVARFMVDYLFEHTRSFHEDLLSENWSDEYIKWIAGYLVSRPEVDRLSERDLYKAYRGFAKLSKDQRAVVMASLVHSGWLDPMERRNPGIPVSDWRVNPKVHAMFQANRVIEADRRKSARELIAAAAEARASEKSERGVN